MTRIATRVRLHGLLWSGALVCALGTVWMTGCHRNEQGFLSSPEDGDLTYGPAPRERFDRRMTDACGPGGLTALGSQAVLRQPYLQKVTSSSAEILWTTDSSAIVNVAITRPDGSLVSRGHAVPDETAQPIRGTQYVARVRALEPGQTLCYELLTEDGSFTTRTGFRTAPATGESTPIRFIAFGDLGRRSPDQMAVLDQMKTVEFDFAVIAGDVAYNDGTREELEANVFGVYNQLMARTAFFPTTGNHDYHTDDARPFREAFALFENGGEQGVERWYSLDWGSLHVAFIDTEKLDAEQAQWLDADLANNQLPWTVVVGHRPPYSSGTHGSDGNVRRVLGPILHRHRVPLAFFGHEHSYERTRPIDGVTYVVTGGAGRGTRSVGVSEFTAHSARVAHFTYVVIDGDTLRMYAIDATGHVFDTFQSIRPSTALRHGDGGCVGSSSSTGADCESVP